MSKIEVVEIKRPIDVELKNDPKKFKLCALTYHDNKLAWCHLYRTVKNGQNVTTYSRMVYPTDLKKRFLGYIQTAIDSRPIVE